jgi:putative glutamine amidotransferase
MAVVTMAGRKPVIGVTLELADPLLEEVERGLREPLEQAGAVMVGLMRDSPVANIDPLLDLLDAVTLTGGADVHPDYYDADPHELTRPITAAHDAFEITLAQRALERGMPILGVCRGAQVLAVADGGALVQDVEALHAGAHRHRYGWRELALLPPAEHWHQVRTEPGSRVAGWFGPSVAVNSFHHQAVRRTGRRLAATAFTADGSIEAVESPADRAFAVGLQWHNELMWRHDARFAAPHHALAVAAADYQAGRALVAAAEREPSGVSGRLGG